jgi:hypothetical protein
MFFPQRSFLVSDKALKKFDSLLFERLRRYTRNTLFFHKATMREYRQMLFPDFETDELLFDYMDGKTVLFIGSDLEYERLYRILAPLKRIDDTKACLMRLIGLNPVISAPEEDRLRIRWMFLQPPTVHAGFEGQLSANEQGAPSFPFADNSIDLILSSFLIPYWVDAPRDLLEIFTEFMRALRAFRQIRLYPILRYDINLLLNRETELGTYIHECFDIHRESKRVIGIGPERISLVLTKKGLEDDPMGNEFLKKFILFNAHSLETQPA